MASTSKHSEKRETLLSHSEPPQGDSWPNKEGKARWVEEEDGQDVGEGRQNKGRVDDRRQGTMEVMMGG